MVKVFKFRLVKLKYHILIFNIYFMVTVLKRIDCYTIQIYRLSSSNFVNNIFVYFILSDIYSKLFISYNLIMYEMKLFIYFV